MAEYAPRHDTSIGFFDGYDVRSNRVREAMIQGEARQTGRRTE